ncbi:hypothetical protein HY638_04650 [Candidatus Woesearchaeota archaeon]|nr:hypothetical protein [Candidatus Woesearchaeota archaeon]
MNKETSDYIRKETIRYLEGGRKEMFAYYTINGRNIPANPSHFGEIADELFLDTKHPLFMNVLISIAENAAKRDAAAKLKDK